MQLSSKLSSFFSWASPAVSSASATTHTAREGLAGRQIHLLEIYRAFPALHKKLTLSNFIDKIGKEYGKNTGTYIKHRYENAKIDVDKKTVKEKYVKQIEPWIKECQTREEYLSNLSKIYGPGIAEEACKIEGLISQNGGWAYTDPDKKTGLKIVAAAQALKHKYSSQTVQLTTDITKERTILNTAIKCTQYAESFKQLDAASLNNFTELTTQEEGLYSIAARLGLIASGLNEFTKIKKPSGAAAFAEYLNHMRVDPAPIIFSELKTPKGQMEMGNWLKEATSKDKQKAAECINYILTKTKTLRADVEEYKTKGTEVSSPHTNSDYLQPNSDYLPMHTNTDYLHHSRAQVNSNPYVNDDPYYTRLNPGYTRTNSDYTTLQNTTHGTDEDSPYDDVSPPRTT